MSAGKAAHDHVHARRWHADFAFIPLLTGKTKLEERAEFKLTKEKRSDATAAASSSSGASASSSSGKRPGYAFALADPDRQHFTLYKVSIRSACKHG